MARIETHNTETVSRGIFETALNRFSDTTSNGQTRSGLYRQITERDYGIDGLAEVFLNRRSTGRCAYIQLKGTEEIIKKLKTVNAVSCAGVSKSNIDYCQQSNIPVILVYVSTADESFYFIDLQSALTLEDVKTQKTVTVRIPSENNKEHMGRLFDIIDRYFEKEQSEIEIDFWEPSTSYEIHIHEKPVDGEHVQLDYQGEPLKKGFWKDGILIKGTEYQWLIRVEDGSLIFKPDCPEDPYDATKDFSYEKMEQYGGTLFFPLTMSAPYIEAEGLDCYYIADLEVEDDMEQLVNIHPLRTFLEERDEKTLKRLLEGITL